MDNRYRALVGLGNPGEAYAETRHNLGFRVVDEVARSLGTTLSPSGRMALAELVRGDEKGAEKGEIFLVLVKPMTYVNLSGEAVAEVRERYGIEPEAMLVVVDDMSLPVGRIRVRGKGSDGGHNGLKSIIAALGTEAFPRLRVGIGSPAADETAKTVVAAADEAVGDTGARDHVLSRFRADELTSVEESIHRAAEAARCWLAGSDLQEIMNTYNRRRTDPTETDATDMDSTDMESSDMESTEAGIQPGPGSDGES